MYTEFQADLPASKGYSPAEMDLLNNTMMEIWAQIETSDEDLNFQNARNLEDAAANAFYPGISPAEHLAGVRRRFGLSA